MIAGLRSLSLLSLSFAGLLPAFAVLPAQDPTQPKPTNAQAPAARLLPSLEHATLAWDCAGAAELPLRDLLDRLAAVDVVFLGETHLDDTTHRVELAVLEGLLARRQGKVVLSMEMFERDVQPLLDDYLQGRLDEASFLERARPWANYRTAYRPLIEAAKAAGIPVVAANFPTALRRKLGAGGQQAFEALAPAERALVPAEIRPASEAYWQRVGRAVRGHMGGGGAVQSAAERLFDGQNLWDNAMGDAVAQARAAHPDHLVLHVAGGFHVAYRDGTVAQFCARSQGSKAAIVEVAPVPALDAARPERDRDRADYLVYAAALARDVDEGSHAVEVPAEMRYRLHVPTRATDAARAPLLVWLADGATRPADAFAYWRAALGDEVALAVVEQPFPELQGDLALGGRWVFGDGYRADYGRAAHALARIVEYVTRRLPVDEGRVVVAGEGDGAAVVLWTAMYGEWLAADMVAIDPTDLTRLQLEGLPDQKPVVRSLELVAHRVAKSKLEPVAEDHRQAGTATTLTELPPDGDLPALLDSKLKLLRLGYGRTEVQLVLERELPRARQWAELYALRLSPLGKPVRVAPAEGPAPGVKVRRLVVGGDGLWPVESFADGNGLPLAGGPFGGTTVVVLPKGTSDADRKAWLELEQQKVLKKRSMFANIAIACADGEPALPQVLQQLKQRGRSRVLIVPAVFCADAAAMQELKQQLGDAAAGMDLAWLPGLGAELARGDLR